MRPKDKVGVQYVLVKLPRQSFSKCSYANVCFSLPLGRVGRSAVKWWVDLRFFCKFHKQYGHLTSKRPRDRIGVQFVLSKVPLVVPLTSSYSRKLVNDPTSKRYLACLKVQGSTSHGNFTWYGCVLFLHACRLMPKRLVFQKWNSVRHELYLLNF